MNDSVKMETDYPLIKQLQQGSQFAFGLLYAKYFSKLYGFSLKLTGSRTDAEEIVQDVFVKIWEMRAELDPERSFSSLLFTIGKHKIYNHARKRVYDESYREYLRCFSSPSERSTEQIVYFNEAKVFFEASLSKMPEKRREIFIMSRQEGLSNREIAQKLNTSISNVENHINKALRTLRRQMTDHDMMFWGLLFGLLS